MDKDSARELMKRLFEKSEASEPPLILGVLIGLAMRTLFEFMR